MSILLRSLVATLLLTVTVPGARAADFLVDSVLDAPDASPGDGICATSGGVCTLRAAIQEANALAGADRVILPAGTFTLTIAGIGEDGAATGDLDVTAPLTIEGAGPGMTIVDAAGIDRVFDVWAETTIRDLTVTGGDPGPGENGGGIFSAPFADDFTLTIERVHFAGNTASHGGGIQNEIGSTLIVRQSSFSDNVATFGGAIENSAGTATLENVTVSGNDTSNFGALRNDGDLAIAHTTVVDATIANSSDLTIRASVLDAGPGGTVCTGASAPVSGGDNVEHGTSCGLAGAGDVSEVDPMLGALTDAGDGTLTHALLTGSPAIDRVAACPPPDADQRGVARPIDGDGIGGAVCDAGAFEAPAAGGTTTTTTTSTSTTTVIVTTTSTTVTTSTTTTSTTVPGATTTTSTTVPGATTTTSTTVPGATTTTVDPTVTTTTIPTSTTTTTLPPSLDLSGRKLLLTDRPNPKRRKLVLLSKDAAITLGDGNLSADDPVLAGGSLRVVAAGGDGFDATYPLPEGNWSYVRKEGQDRGYKFRRGTPVRKLLVRPGKVLKVVAKGEVLAHSLATQPEAVLVEVRLGAQRYCFAFGDDVAFRAEKRYLARDAAAPAGCPDDAAAASAAAR